MANYSIKQSEVIRSVRERFDEDFEKEGFVFKRNYYYRKNGRIFQAVVLDVYNGCAKVLLTQFPYWAADLKTIRGTSLGTFAQRLREKKKWIFGEQLCGSSIDCHADWKSYPEKDRDDYFGLLNRINDEFSLCSVSAEGYMNYIGYMPDAVVLYCSYLQGSMDFAKEYYEKMHRQCYKANLLSMIYNILLESEIYAEKRKEIEPRLLEAYKGYYAEKKVPINTRPFRLLNLEREERIEKAEEQLDALELEPNLKLQMMNEAEEGAKRTMSINMSRLKSIIDSGDLEYGKRVYDEQSPLMREFFLKTLKLDFSE